MVERKSFLDTVIHPLLVFLGYMFLYLPIIVLITFSFNDGSISLSWQGFTFRWYREMLASPELLSALKTSLIVATSSTILSVVLSVSLVIASLWWRPFFLFTPFYASVVLYCLVFYTYLLGIVV